MIGREIRRLRQGVRWPKNLLLGRRVLILLYHRVAELRSDPWSLAVTPRHFLEHLEVLRQYAHPIRLQQLSQALLDNSLPRRLAVITFDDGYADNLHNAKPLLERYNVPATVFLVTGYIGGEREFWWDELDRLLLQPGTLPRVLRLSVNGSIHQWDLGEAANYSEDAARRYRNWRAQEDAPTTPRHSLYISLWKLLHPLSESERRKVLDELLAWAEAKPAVRPTHRPLSLEEVITLAQGNLIEVGAHTVTHPALTALPVTSQRTEILESKAQLEEILGRRVDSFSYPHGILSTETAGMVREAGFTYACSTYADLVARSADRVRLPRIPVQDWDKGKFARRLWWWFHY